MASVPVRPSVAPLTSETFAQDPLRDLDVTPVQIDQLRRFADLVAASNRRLNLVSRRGGPGSAVLDQVLESLLAQPLIASLHPETVLDLGSGGGFPGVPLAILNPRIRFRLLEASCRRAAHLRHVIRELPLENAEVLEGRAEALARVPDHAHSLDMVVARAVAEVVTLAGWARPFLRPGGRLVTFAGPEEAADVGRLRASRPPESPFTIRSLDTGLRPESPRRLLIVACA